VKIWCILGDGELVEGSNWEALFFASKYNLNNLIAVLDLNKMGQSNWSAHSDENEHNAEIYKKKAESFGFNALIVDGHSIEDLAEA